MQFGIALSSTRAKLSGIDMSVTKRVTARQWLLVILLALVSLTPFAEGQDSQELLRQGDLAVLQGRFDAAMDAYQSAMRAGAVLDKDSLRSRNLALCELNAAPPDFVQAIRWFQVSLSLDPRDEDTRLQLARTLLRIGKFDQAAEQYRALVQAHGDSTEYAIGLSDSLRGGGKTSDALEFLGSTLAKYPENIGIRLEYARLLSYEKLFDKAREQYQAVLRAQPTNLRAQVGIAKITSWQGDQEGALARYNGILEKNPSYYDAQVGKAFTLLWMGRQAEARPLLEAAARRYPDDQEVRDALRSLNGSSAKAALPTPAPLPGRHPSAESTAVHNQSPKTNTSAARTSAPEAPKTVAKPSATQPSPNSPAPNRSNEVARGVPAERPKSPDSTSAWSKLWRAPIRNTVLWAIGIVAFALFVLNRIYAIKTRKADTYVHDAQTNRQQHYMPRGGGDEYARLIPTPQDETSSLSLDALHKPRPQEATTESDTPTFLDLESVFLAAELEAALDASAPDLPAASAATSEGALEVLAQTVSSAPVPDAPVVEQPPVTSHAQAVSEVSPVAPTAEASPVAKDSSLADVPVEAFFAQIPPPAETQTASASRSESTALPLDFYSPPPPTFTIDFEPPQSLMNAFASDAPIEQVPLSVPRMERETHAQGSLETPVFSALHGVPRSSQVAPVTELPNAAPQISNAEINAARGVLSGKKILIVGTFDELIDHESRMLRDADADVWVQPTWREGLRFMERVAVDIAILHQGEDGWSARDIQSYVSQQRPGFEKRLVFVVSPEDRERATGIRVLVQPFLPNDVLELLVTVH